MRALPLHERRRSLCVSPLKPLHPTDLPKAHMTAQQCILAPATRQLHGLEERTQMGTARDMVPTCLSLASGRAQGLLGLFMSCFIFNDGP